MADDRLHDSARRGLFDLYRRERRSVWLNVVGSSMSPTLEDGSALLVEFGPDRIEVGQIAVFELGETVVVHRVVGISKRHGMILLKGDGRLGFDAPVERDRILAIARSSRGADGTQEHWPCEGRSARAIARVSAGAGRLATHLDRLPRLARRPAAKILFLIVPTLSRLVRLCHLAPRGQHASPVRSR